MDNFFPSIEQYFMTETISPRHLWESNCFMDDNIYDFFMAFKYDLDDICHHFVLKYFMIVGSY